jgi:hypothetical protein
MAYETHVLAVLNYLALLSEQVVPEVEQQRLLQLALQ